MKLLPFIVPILLMHPALAAESATPAEQPAAGTATYPTQGYQDALELAKKANPPGDYNGRPVVKFLSNADLAPNEQVPMEKGTIEWLLSQPVESTDKDRPTLFSEAATYFDQGRWDLAVKRYQQILLIEPANNLAKVNVYDILVLRSLQAKGVPPSIIDRMHRELAARLAGDVVSPAVSGQAEKAEAAKTDQK